MEQTWLVNDLIHKLEMVFACGTNEQTEVVKAALRRFDPAPVTACRIVKQYLNRLEESTPDQSALEAIRKRIHAPLHAALDEALK